MADAGRPRASSWNNPTNASPSFGNRHPHRTYTTRAALAEALEHEIDHLNGILYVDHIQHEDKLYRIEPAEKAKPAI